jgi:O-succinylbenzoic acid--CoA ligase
MSLSVRDAARENPTDPALVTPDRSWSWHELAERVVALAGRFARLPGAPAPLAFTGSADEASVVRLLAAIEAGRAAVPLSPGLDVGSRRSLVEALGAVEVEGTEAGEAGSVPGAPAAPADDGRPLAIVRTSGSTGAPKAVELSRAAFVASAEASARRLGWQPDDRWLLVLPLAHVGGLSVLTRCLLARKPVALASPESARADLFRAAEAAGATLVSLVPTMLRRALDARPQDEAPSGLRIALLGGARAPFPLLREAWNRGVPVVPSYGLTEACSQVATALPGEPPDPGGSVGPPLAGTEIRIAGGRIEIRSPSLMTRYLPEGRWPSPLTGDGWLRTEDGGRLDGRGRLRPLGRLDRAITTGGVTVQAGEIEAALEVLPGVAEALAVGRPDPVWGERIAALIVPGGGEPADGPRVAELIRRIRALPGAVRPRSVALVPRLPRSALGKPDRAALELQSAPWIEL